MKTYFYENTAYLLLSERNIEVPRCFNDLDGYFGSIFSTFLGGTQHQSVQLAENLCRRMADVEYFASFISYAHKKDVPKKRDEIKKATPLIGTLLVAYFSSCKSLLDAASISLAKMYLPELTNNKDMDFSKKEFRKALKQTPTVWGRYEPFQNLVGEIVKYRDASIHRVTPFVIVDFTGHNGAQSDIGQVKVLLKPDVDMTKLNTIRGELRKNKLVEPMYFHKKWQPRLIKLCEEVCKDIQNNTSSP